MGIADTILDAWSLLMPVECAGCGAEGRGMCRACVAQLVASPTARLTAGGLSVVTAVRYEAVVRRTILSLKEENRTDAAAHLARPLAAAITRALDPAAPAPELAPVPTSRAAYRRRGYDPVALIMRRAGLRPARVLRQVRSTATQKSLGVADRTRNLRGAMAARSTLAGRRFVLVDDVLTTGATLEEAARAIRAARGEVVGAVAIAFTPRLIAFRDIASDEDYGGPKGAMS